MSASESRFPFGHPSRVAQGPVHLAAPLRLAWQDSIGFMVTQLPLIADGVAVYLRSPTLRAHHEADHRRLWMAKTREADPACVWEGRVVAWSGPRRAVLLDLATGQETGSFDSAPVTNALVTRGLLIGVSNDAIRACELPSGRARWAGAIAPPRFGPGDEVNACTAAACADDERVYFGLRDGTIAALSLEDGSEAWRRVAFPQAPYGIAEPRRTAQLRAGVVFFHSGPYVGAFDARTGRSRWTHDLGVIVHDACIHGDRCYVIGGEGVYAILDLAHGREVFRADLRQRVPAKLWDRNETFRPIAVSETHMFCGLGIGYVLAFERETAELAWHHAPKPRASFHGEARMAIVGGRLYAGSMGVLRAFEAAGPRGKMSAS